MVHHDTDHDTCNAYSLPYVYSTHDMWYIHIYVQYAYSILYTAGLLRPKLFVAQDFEMISLGN
jgi:hypothetical protein